MTTGLILKEWLVPAMCIVMLCLSSPRTCRFAPSFAVATLATEIWFRSLDVSFNSFKNSSEMTFLHKLPLSISAEHLWLRTITVRYLQYLSVCFEVGMDEIWWMWLMKLVKFSWFAAVGRLHGVAGRISFPGPRPRCPTRFAALQRVFSVCLRRSCCFER